MTHEEAKKIGATHCDELGNYFKHKDGMHWFRLSVAILGVFWFAEIHKPAGIKPL